MGSDIRAIHSLALLTSSGGSFLEDFTSLLALEMQGNVPGAFLERKGGDVIHIGLHWVKNGCSLYCARFPLALLLATINLCYCPLR